jgi:hypothetical protein
MAQDSTLFAKVLHNYKKIVHHLLKANAIPGLYREELASFKQHYGSSAFVCRFRGCPRATDGYSTERELEDHETLQHTGGIKCTETSCSYRIYFKTSVALKRHMQKFHSMPERLKRPNAPVRRKYICGTQASIDGVSWGCGERFAFENELQRHFDSTSGQRCLLERSVCESMNNPFAHPPPPGSNSQNGAAYGGGNNNMDTPISALPSRFVPTLTAEPSPGGFVPTITAEQLRLPTLSTVISLCNTISEQGLEGKHPMNSVSNTNHKLTY